MASLMEAEYDSPMHQAKVQAEIESLCLPVFMCENELSSLPEGLTKIVDRIKVLTPQDPLPFRDEQTKIRHLRLAVLSSTWYQ